MLAILAMAALSVALAAGDPPTGQVVDEVVCSAQPAQSYALYLPANYTPEKAWPVIYLFDAGGRGRNAVERYREAAETYGYIVASSNNSRNGRPNAEAIVAMPADVTARFHVDPSRVYTGGMSGGARVAFGVALEGKVAGVFASSASYPDAEPRRTLPFAVYATTGTEDFNRLEMHKFERPLTTPHRLVSFEGGHQWPPAPLVTDGVEWMELQAMKSRLKPKDEQEIERLLAKRLAAARLERDGRPTADAAAIAEQYRQLDAIATDFQGLRDVSAIAKRAAALARDPAVRNALKQDRDEDDLESRTVLEVQAEETRLEVSRQRLDAMSALQKRWQAFAAAANQPEDSAARRMARRLMAWLAINTMTMDEEYRDLVREIRTGRSPGL